MDVFADWMRNRERKRIIKKKEKEKEEKDWNASAPEIVK